MINLRPNTLKEVIGNENIKNCLDISIGAAKKENRAHPHTILHGHPGSGKTTLARVIANEMGGKFIEVNGAAFRKNSDILNLFPQIKDKTVLFIDEIHRLKVKHEELFYSLMEDFKAFIPVEGMETKPIDIPKFTLIGATTDLGSISGPMMTRFQLNFSVKPYSIDDLAQIVRDNTKKLNLNISHDASIELAKRCKNVPRYVNHRLLWLRDYCSKYNINNINLENIKNALNMIGIDENGFDETDRMYLEVVSKHQPIGLTNLAAALSVTSDTVIKYIEPYMLSKGLIVITREGRMLKDYYDDRGRSVEEILDGIIDI